jgi:hypothetical protein
MLRGSQHGELTEGGRAVPDGRPGGARANSRPVKARVMKVWVRGYPGQCSAE